MKEGEKILRYAQLIFKRESYEARHLLLPMDDSLEIERIKDDLDLSHEEIMDRVAKNLIDELE